MVEGREKGRGWWRGERGEWEDWIGVRKRTKQMKKDEEKDGGRREGNI